MEQVARNLTDPGEGFLRTSRHLIHDSDPLHTHIFEETLRSVGVEPIRRPGAESESQRLRGAICPVDQGRVSQSSRAAWRGPPPTLVEEYLEHYHRERNHQGRHNRLL